MPIRKATATWQGGFKEGTGSFEGETGTIAGSFTAGSRFGDERGTNPEELLAAAHASCFSMALTLMLERAGHEPRRVATTAACSIDKVGEGFTITTIRLTSRVDVPGIDEAALQEIGNAAKEGCPVSRALTGVSIELDIASEQA